MQVCCLPGVCHKPSGSRVPDRRRLRAHRLLLLFAFFSCQLDCVAQFRESKAWFTTRRAAQCHRCGTLCPRRVNLWRPYATHTNSTLTASPHPFTPSSCQSSRGSTRVLTHQMPTTRSSARGARQSSRRARGGSAARRGNNSRASDGGSAGPAGGQSVPLAAYAALEALQQDTVNENARLAAQLVEVRDSSDDLREAVARLEARTDRQDAAAIGPILGHLGDVGGPVRAPPPTPLSSVMGVPGPRELSHRPRWPPAISPLAGVRGAFTLGALRLRAAVSPAPSLENGGCPRAAPGISVASARPAPLPGSAAAGFLHVAPPRRLWAAVVFRDYLSLRTPSWGRAGAGI